MICIGLLAYGSYFTPGFARLISTRSMFDVQIGGVAA